MVALESGVHVFVGERVEEEVRSSKTGGVWFVVVCHFLCVEELARVVCIIASLLKQ